MRAQDTAEMAWLTFEKLVYAGHPYSRPEDGYLETVQAICQEDLVDFHRQHYGPRGMLIAVAGAVEPERVVDAALRLLGDWENPAQALPASLPPVIALEGVRTQQISIPGKVQADLVIGAAGPSRRSPDYLAAALGNDILGQFGLMGRIGQSVREQAGMAYYAHSDLNGGNGPGPWHISAGVDPENVEAALELIGQEVARFTTEPVSEEELSDSQAHFTGSLPLSLESNAGMASALLRLERYALGLDYYRHYPDLVHSITREAVLQAARQYLDPLRLGTAIAGP
jgi:zinc protease